MKQFYTVCLMLLAVCCFAGNAHDNDCRYAKALQAEMETIISDYAIPDMDEGLLFACMEKEKVHTYTAGAIRPDNALRIASVTKMFVSYLVLSTKELDLGRTLDNWYAPGLYPESDKITIRMLLNHTSGISDYLGYVDWNSYLSKEDIINAAYNPAVGLTFEPGTQWCYSNTGYVILGDILERTTGYTIARLWQKTFAKKAPSFYVDDGRANDFPASYYAPWPFHWSVPWVAGGGICEAADLLKVFDWLTGKPEFRAMQEWMDELRCAEDIVAGELYGLGLQFYNLGELGTGLGLDGDIICRSLLIQVDKKNYYIHTTWPVDNSTLKAIALRLLAVK